jgi:hypothetical protein
VTNVKQVGDRRHTRLASQFALGITWAPLGCWTAVLLGNHVFALLGCASPNAPEPVTPTASIVAALATALLTVSSLAACRREEDPWPRTEWPIILAAILTGAVSLLSGLLAVVLATDVSLPNSPDESTPGLVVVIAICLQSLMAVLIGSVTALRLFTWRSTVRRRLTAATVLLVLLGAALVGLSDIGSQLLCA